MDENTQALYTQYMNDLNAMQQANNNWSAEQAQIAREWDYFMSSTAHEREVADLRRAGLNPVLSAGGSGASAGSAAMAESSGSGVSAMASLMSKMLDASIAQSKASAIGSQANLAQIEKGKGETSGNVMSPYELAKDPIASRTLGAEIHDAITEFNKNGGGSFKKNFNFDLRSGSNSAELSENNFVNPFEVVQNPVKYFNGENFLNLKLDAMSWFFPGVVSKIRTFLKHNDMARDLLTQVNDADSNFIPLSISPWYFISYLMRRFGNR